MKVCHIGTKPLHQMGIITRSILSLCKGEHVYITVYDVIPNADVYVLHCFKKHSDFFYKFRAPNDGMIISLIHSSAPCVPCIDSDAIVCLSYYSAWDLTNRYEDKFIEPRVIYGAIDCISEKTSNFIGQVFGRISRNAEGKFNFSWDAIVKNVLNELPNSRLQVFTNKRDGFFLNERTNYTTDVLINTPTSEKLNLLRQLSVASICHGEFEETFSVEALECMSAGLPIVYMYQPALYEIIGPSQVCCRTVEEYAYKLKAVLNDIESKRIIGGLAQKRALNFNNTEMIAQWNDLLEEVCA